MTTHTITIPFITGFDAALADLSRRGTFSEPEPTAAITEKTKEVFGESLAPREVVDRIVRDVQERGDEAVAHYTRAFDGKLPNTVEVAASALDEAWNNLPTKLQAALTTAAERIEAFHRRQHRPSWIEPEPLGVFGQLVRPLERVGIYTPGGTAVLPSSLLMTVIPARVAGVDEIILCAPPGRDGKVAAITLAAARLAGVHRVFAIGGAQAIAAMAFGTATVPHVDKVLGPGNMFVALAKQRVFGVVDIDQIAGPTETLLIADDTADVELVAADMLAQSEHDVVASAILITTSRSLAEALPAEIERQLASLERREIAEASLQHQGRIVLVETLDEAIALSNAYAPEHLCLLVRDPWALVPQARHAGGIFIGESSPEALGDYTAGPSHVMPTGGTARYSSPVNVSDFQKIISVFAANEQAIDVLGDATIEMANAEGLGGHAAAIHRRRR